MFDTGGSGKGSKKRNRETLGDNLGELFDSGDEAIVEHIVEENSDEQKA